MTKTIETLLNNKNEKIIITETEINFPICLDCIHCAGQHTPMCDIDPYADDFTSKACQSFKSNVNVPNIVWLSQHDLTEQQMKIFKDKYFHFNLIKIDGTIDKNVLSKISKYLKNAAIVGAVAPAHLMNNILPILNKNTPLIYSVTDRVRKSEGGFEFKFLGWKEIKRILVEDFA